MDVGVDVEVNVGVDILVHIKVDVFEVIFKCILQWMLWSEYCRIRLLGIILD